MRCLAVLLLWLAGPVLGCTATDWLSLPLPRSGDPIEIALETAYPGAHLKRAAGVFISPDGTSVPFREAQAVGPQTRLRNATIGDQFHHAYPLAFDLTARRTPWEDPGRLRNDAFFRAVWFRDRRAARATLQAVRYPGQRARPVFQMTTKHCVHAQLSAALAEIAALGPQMDRYFHSVGGSFNWRVIAGTQRLSAHSFGISVDFNTELGGYWRWSGAAPGQATEFTNRYPETLVRAMERYGFIWGGKWHHFHAMHFEYRPELILAARLVSRR